MKKLDRLRVQREQLREYTSWWDSLYNDTAQMMPPNQRSNMNSVRSKAQELMQYLAYIIDDANANLMYWVEPVDPEVETERDEIRRRERRTLAPDKT